jgi:type III restriction enzyme
MFNEVIYQQAKIWLNSPECKITSVIEYIRQRGFLREPQIEAIEVYLFLKLAGQNKPLWQLLSEGFFSKKEDLARLHMSQEAREIFEQSVSARSLFEFVRQQNNNTASTLSPNEKLLAENASSIDFEEVARKIFYGVDYADYLFSLPMGAGKTFLMVSFMYLDLYFAQTEPDNKLFAHNFLILIPSGLKSSIIPSLKTIERFDPNWIIPEPTASSLKRMIKFEVLDEAKSGKKSNKARNPNVQKIARHQPFQTLTGLVMVVNAEKVILDRLELDKQHELIEKDEDERDHKANELRAFIGKIPNLQIHIDEVHHATDDEIKLRQVVSKWSRRGNINSVLGFSGTPYLSKKEKIKFAENVAFESLQIINTVYYYPLLQAIKTFLKKPTIKETETGLTSLQIVKRGVEDFYKLYGETDGTKEYNDNTNAKLAIYCGTIERLEAEIYPFLVDELKIEPDKILRYHKGNKEHPQPKDSELEFKSLDTPLSKKEIILLVQIGKEGWDCRSLTGVILSQKKDCPPNMVLQTSCRCLRQVDKGKEETAIIWLNEDNAQILQKQLKEEQQTSITEINSLSKTKQAEKVERYSRLEYLKLPKVDFYQLKVEYDTLITNGNLNPQQNLSALEIDNFFNQAIIAERRLDTNQAPTRSIISEERGEGANFYRWLFEVSKGSFSNISIPELKQFEKELRDIFENITFIESGKRFFNDLYEQNEIQSQIRLAFHIKRELQTKSEIIPDSARMLIVEKLQAVAKSEKLYPKEDEVKQIIDLDASGMTVEEKEQKQKEDYQKALELLRSQGIEITPNLPKEFLPAVKCKDRTFHFLPYKFDSTLEFDTWESSLTLKQFQDCNLEVYFNGEKDITDFRIKCYTDKNRYVGLYTPDFLIIQRRDGQIHRVLIIETKGKGFAEQTAFKLRRKFVETEFLQMNNEKFGYERFDYLYLTDADKQADNLIKLNDKIQQFFCD